MGERRTAVAPGTATGIGSMPGTDVRETVRLVLGELRDLPHLPELPARGPGADLVGRTAALLVDLHVDRQPSGWRLVSRPGLDERRARGYLREDLDALEEAAEGLTGPLKVQLAGPWTLTTAVELPRGDKALSDPGAVRDVTASLTEAVREHLLDVRRRVPGADLLVQLDEPSLPAVLAGQVPTVSGFGRLAAIDEPAAEQVLSEVIAAAAGVDVPVAVHCCAAEPPLALLRRAGASALSVDATVLDLHRPGRLDDVLGELIEDEVPLWAGLVHDGNLSDVAGTVAPVRQLWRRLGLDPARLASAVVVTPTCGLAGTSPERARAVLSTVRAAARVLVEDPEG